MSSSSLKLTTSLELNVVLYTPPDATRLRFLTTTSLRREEDKSKLQLEAAKQDAYSIPQGLNIDRDIKDVLPFVSGYRGEEPELTIS